MTDNVVTFPQTKLLEKKLRELYEEGEALHLLAAQLTNLTDSWIDDLIQTGTEYINKGGTDTELVAFILLVKKAQEVLRMST